MGFLNVFMFFNTQDGPTKYHSFLYYLVTLIELCLILLFTKDIILIEFGSAPIWISVVCYTCAIVMMVIYYTIFHPSKLNQSENETKSPLTVETVQIVETYQPLPRFQHLER